jgi:hypothetical protein
MRKKLGEEELHKLLKRGSALSLRKVSSLILDSTGILQRGKIQEPK